MVLPEVVVKGVRGSKRSRGRDLTPERRMTSRVVQRTEAMLLPMGQPLPEVGGIEGSSADLAQQQRSSSAAAVATGHDVSMGSSDVEQG